SGLSGGGGSWSNTSRPAPNSLLSASARASAASSITGPRLVLTMIASGFIEESSCAPIMWRVVVLSGTCRVTMSEIASSSPIMRKRTPSASSASSVMRTIILHPHAEGARQPRHLLADGAETDDAESLAVDFVHARCWAVAAPTSARNIGMLRDHAARHHE